MKHILLIGVLLILFSSSLFSTSQAYTSSKQVPITIQKLPNDLSQSTNTTYKVITGTSQKEIVSHDSTSLDSIAYTPILLYLNTVIAGTPHDEINPCIDIDEHANPYVVYSSTETTDTTPSSDIYFHRSIDYGQTWPSNQRYIWDKPDTNDINPKISVFPDGSHAVGTHEVIENNSFLFLHNYMDLSNPNTWVMTRFDLTPTVTNVRESTITCQGNNTIAISGVVDVSYHEYDLEGTLVIFWNENGTEEQWPGLFLTNQKENGDYYEISDLAADAGDFIYVIFLLSDPGVDTSLYLAYCPSTSLVFEEWDLAILTGGRHTITNPDISADDSHVYIVFQEDRRGSMDVVCYSKLEGGFWRRSVIAASAEDETHPVVSAVGNRAICLYHKAGNLYEVQSDDAGVTWSQPQQVNEVYGSVQNDNQGSDVSGFYGIWTDNRYNNNDIFLNEVGAVPFLRLEEITGGLSINAAITNLGNAPERDIEWSIALDGSVFPKTKTGIIQMLHAGGTASVKTGMLFGFGDIEIQVSIGDTTTNAQGFITGPFVFIK